MIELFQTTTQRRLRPTFRSRGVVTVWAILAIPVAVTLVCVLVEVAHLWLARLELQQGLEAAALAGVKRWADVSTTNNHATPGAISETHAARIAAQASAAGNTVSGQPIVLGLNELDDGNTQTGFDNASCSGDILLGGFPTTGSTAFFATAGVGCGRTTTTTTIFTVTYNITIDTGNSGNTSNVANAFTIGFTTAQAGVSLTKLQIDLQHITAPPQVPAPVGVFQPDPAGPPYSWTGLETGSGPTIDGSSGVGSATFTFNPSKSVMTITVPPGTWTSGTNLVFGVDTDGVRVNGGAVTATDQGGDFGESGGASSTAASDVEFAFGYSGGPLFPLAKTLQRTGASRSNLQGNPVTISNTITVVVPDVDFAVLTQKTVNITPICTQIFGVPLGTLHATGRAVATARCVGGGSFLVQNPQGVFFTAVNCP